MVEHDWLTLDKAAAVLTKRHDRLADLDARQKANDTDPDRDRLAVVCEWLTDPQHVHVRLAMEAADAAQQAPAVEAAHAEATRVRAALVARRTRLEADQRDLGQQAARQPQLERDANAARADALSADDRLQRTRARIHDVRLEHAAALTERHRAEASFRSWRNKLPWKRAGAHARHAELVTRVDELGTVLAGLEATLPDLVGSAERVAEQAARAAARVAAAADASSRLAGLAASRPSVDREVAAAGAQLDRLGAELAALNARATRVDDAKAVLERASADGVLALFVEHEALITSVAALDEEHALLARERAGLDDEYAGTKRHLLGTAPVIACTLASLATRPELAARRFGIVIVDEAAAATVPQLVYAGSRADDGLALVGDFLQNAPISDPGDAITARDHLLLPWQRDDIFALLGIHDRATAEAHSRCVALRTQYRFPSTIADIVNDFCYDGLLESHRQVTADHGTIVTLIDTSGHPRGGLRRAGASWVHGLGLELMEAIVEPLDEGPIGLVCPYRAHADAGTRAAREHGLHIECGTSHRFQGRQFRTVIVDLMQDADQPRWVATADLTGNQRAVSAAKLLNVALTRAQERLYLIGDWHFIATQRTSGMRALSVLRGREHVELVPATYWAP